MHGYGYNFDADLEMKDAGLVASSGAAQVAGVDKVLNLGAGAGGRLDVVVDVTAIELDTANEKYEIEVQLSDVSNFATGVVVAAVLKLGDSSVNGGSADSIVGRYILPFVNLFAGTTYQYARLFTRIAGTIATGINYSAFAAPPMA
jgi:hypothetical protein